MLVVRRLCGVMFVLYGDVSDGATEGNQMPLQMKSTRLGVEFDGVNLVS